MFQPPAERSVFIDIHLLCLLPSAVKGPFGNTDFFRDFFNRVVHKTHVAYMPEGEVILYDDSRTAPLPAANGLFRRRIFGIAACRCRVIFRGLYINCYHQIFRNGDGHHRRAFIPGKVKIDTGSVKAVL